MREILFRGKRLDNGEWIEGSLAYVEENYFIVLPAIEWNEHLDCEAPVFIPVNPDTIGQYTGLQDKNGVKIFEGDILEITIFRTYEDHHRRVATIWRTAVEYYDGAFTIKDHGETYPLSEYIYPGGACVYQSEFEVIGNIYDNPDLLKVTP